jgi:hypothetical protein
MVTTSSPVCATYELKSASGVIVSVTARNNE